MVVVSKRGRRPVFSDTDRRLLQHQRRRDLHWPELFDILLLRSWAAALPVVVLQLRSLPKQAAALLVPRVLEAI
jgi:hypothetical protein